MQVNEAHQLVLTVETVWSAISLNHLWCNWNLGYVWVHNRSNMPMFCLKKLISQPWVVQESPSLAQMTFTQCASMSDLKFDSVAPPGGQIHQYVSFSVLFQSPTKDMAQKYGSTVKNLILGFSPKLSGGVLIYVWKPGKNFGPKSQC